PNLSNTDSVEYQDYLTYTHKKHTIKGGIQFDYEKVGTLNKSNFNGAYSFTSIDQYSAALQASMDPSAPQCNPSQFDPRNLAANPCATQFTITMSTVNNPELDYKMWRGSWFIMDDFRMRPNLTFSYGLRHEFQGHVGDKLNFAPRLGIAYSPTRKTVIRAGAGIFFDRLSDGNYLNTIRFPMGGGVDQNFIIRNPIFIPGINVSSLADLSRLVGGGTVLRGNQNTYLLEPNLKEPYSINGSISIERQLPKSFVGSFTYFQDRGIHQFRTRNINAPRPLNL